MAKAKVLVAEDDRAVRESIERALRFEGHDVSVAADGGEALRQVAADPPDAIVMDVMMPVMDGLDVTRELRAKGDRTPILVLTARHKVSDRVAGLDAGADDYLVKPYALEELLARLRALLRRTPPGGDEHVLEVGDLRLDPATREVHRGQNVLELTKTEFALLELLMVNVNIVLPRSTIYERIWDYDFGPTSNALEVYIGYLRRKTEPDGAPRLIHTVRGVGYVMRVPR
jgi:two-component system, OmpR family, response regulator MprA